MSAELILTGRRQTTIARPVRFGGVSVRDFRPCSGELLPAPADAGIVFETEGARLPAVHDSLLIGGPSHTTTLTDGDAVIMTVEHLLAACHGLGLDNLIVRVGPAGIPFEDFSAEAFCRHLLAAGRRELDAPRAMLKITAPFRFSLGGDDRYAEVSPLDRWNDACAGEIEAVTDFPAPIGRQTACFIAGETDFVSELAWARSFVRSPLDADGDKWARVRKRYPVLPDDPRRSPLVAYDESGFITPLRRPDEPGRHKLLDLLGDLMLAGWRVAGKIRVYKPGHSFNAELAGELLRRMT